MLIDWFTVTAQALNFLVLVWLLTRYLYKPVLAAIDAREKQITLAVTDAAAERRVAGEERAALAAKEAALEADRAALANAAAETAAAERDRLLAQARAEVQQLRAQLLAALQDDQTRLNQEISRLATQEVLAIVRKTLAEMAGAPLEEQMILLLAKHLHALEEPAKATLREAFGHASEAMVRSSFEMPEAPRALISDMIHQELSAAIAIRFETSTETLCGIELSAGGQKLAWSFAESLYALEQKIASLNSSERSVGAR